MPKAKITKTFVEQVPLTEKGQVAYCDTELRGFYVIVGMEAKTYVAQKDIGQNCMNFNAPVGLEEFCDQVDSLRELCDFVKELAPLRNRFVHGLITTVDNENRLLYRRSSYELVSNNIQELKDQAIYAILELNRIIPISGLSIEHITGSEIHIKYEELVLEDLGVEVSAGQS